MNNKKIIIVIFRYKINHKKQEGIIVKKISNFFKMMLLTSSACFLGNITSISFKNTNIINDKSFNKVNLKQIMKVKK